MKFFMAIVVIAIHTNPLSVLGIDMINNIAAFVMSLAVPFFFTASGFFIGKKTLDKPVSERLQSIYRYIAKMCRLYVVWTAIFLPFTIYGFVADGLTVWQSVVLFSRNVLFVGENFMSWPLWYLLGGIVGGSLVYLMTCFRLSLKWMIGVAALLYVLKVVIDSSNADDNAIVSLYLRLFKNTRNGIFIGFQYLVLGMFIGQVKAYASKALCLSLLVFGLFIHFCGFQSSLFIVDYALFALLLQTPVPCDDRCKFLRQLSGIVYFTHMLYVAPLMILSPDISPMVLFVIATILSVMGGYYLMRFSNTNWYRVIFA